MESCRFYGETVWDRCWWINNVKYVTFAVLIGVWLGPFFWKTYKSERSSEFSPLLVIWTLFLGIPVGAWAAFRLIEPFLFNVLGGMP